MIKFRNVTTAFLMNDDDFLLMKRSDNNKHMPGFWYGVGGHLEKDELNNPRAACIREIFEETGINENQLANFKLKYIAMRRSYNETVINYIYFGQSSTRDVVENDEGSLHWINKKTVLNHAFVDALRLTLSHYLESGEIMEDVLIGVVKLDENNNSAINWSVLQDMKDMV
ncbi:MAG: hydrolase [Bacillota bacterium]|jgi:8-oxo-dGTP diphosphatase|nr:hydrolase [Bacillota bacterium]